MKKLTLLFAVLLVVAAAGPALAHKANREPVFKIFGIAEPSLLPDSGFYFFKEIGRGFRRFFTFDAVKKAEFELEIADEKLAELEKVTTKSEAPEDAIKDAFDNYLEAQERLAQRLESLKGKNKNVDALLGKLADRVIEHEELFNALEDEFKKEESEKATKEIAKAVKKAAELDEEKFKEKIKAKIKENEEDDEEELEAIEDIFEADDELEELEEDLDETLEDINKSIAEDELEESENEIEAARDRVKESELTGKDAAEAARLLAEAERHWGFAKRELEKENYEQVKVHLGHVAGFLQDLANLLATGKKSKDLEDCGPQPGAPGNWVCKDRKWQLVENRPQEPVVCTQQYDPVCGVDGKTYSNSCFAETAGVKIAHKGNCAGLKVEEPPFQVKPSPTPSQPQTQEFKLEADDSGFYPSSMLAVAKGAKIKITFTVRKTNVYYGGLDFRSPKFESKFAKPGETASVEFTADESFVITSYWPLSGVKKAELKVEVR